MKPFTTNARDYGLALIARINRVMLGGAVALAGLLSVAAAKTFHGHQHRASTITAPSSSAGSTGSTGTGAGNTGNTGAGNTGNTGGLQGPSQAPAPVQQVPAPVQQAPVVSGGS